MRWLLAPFRLISRVISRFFEERLTLAAAALSFDTLLGLVPMIAVGLGLSRYFPLAHNFYGVLEKFFITNLLPIRSGPEIANYLGQFALRAQEIPLLGVMALIVTALIQTLTIEQAFNGIWKDKTRRPFFKRLAVHLLVLLLGPVAFGGSLALMDAGVPVQDHVAGVAMGLIKDGNKFAVLTDILGDEDHLGDMDFKVAGTKDGITALQMDIKIQGITKEIMQAALAQAKEGRMHILGKMEEAITGSRQELSSFAPRMLTVKINPEKIRDVIGKGGATIRALTEETGSQIDISDEGLVTISSADLDKAKEAERRILEITAEVEVNQVYDGTVQRMLDFGAIVQILPGKDGLLHISEIANYRINDINEVLSVGQKLRVKVIEADDRGRIRLSVKALGGIENEENLLSSTPEAGSEE